jgi:hypothetical protein
MLLFAAWNSGLALSVETVREVLAMETEGPKTSGSGASLGIIELESVRVVAGRLESVLPAFFAMLVDAEAEGRDDFEAALTSILPSAPREGCSLTGNALATMLLRHTSTGSFWASRSCSRYRESIFEGMVKPFDGWGDTDGGGCGIADGCNGPKLTAVGLWWAGLNRSTREGVMIDISVSTLPNPKEAGRDRKVKRESVATEE